MKVLITQKVSDNLAFRDSAEAFFHEIETLPDQSITIDFSGVKFISRSFAHEYLARKKQSSKTLKETHVPESVRKMFHVVLHPSKKFELPKPTVRRIDRIDAVFT